MGTAAGVGLRLRPTYHAACGRRDHTLMPNLWQDNALTAAIPFAFTLYDLRAPKEHFLPEYVRAAEPSDRVQHSGAADLSRRAEAQDVPAEYAD